MSQTLQQMFASAAVIELPPSQMLRIEGPDAKRWLNGMVTASAQSLEDGGGAYTFLLNSQGRILGDGTLYREGDTFLLRTAQSQVELLQAHLDRYIIMDDVELSLLPAAPALLIAGPEAVERLIELDLAAPASTAGVSEQSFSGNPVRVFTERSPLLPRVQITGGTATLAELAESLRSAGVAAATEQDFAALRVMEGSPLYGVDITERDLPQETSQDHALHFSKGCYLGQEIVERIHSRGQVHRHLQLFALTAPVSAEQLPLALTAGSDPARTVGSITSAATFEFRGRQTSLGLGIVRRQATAAGTSLSYSGGNATAVTLPFDPTRLATAAD